MSIFQSNWIGCDFRCGSSQAALIAMRSTQATAPALNATQNKRISGTTQHIYIGIQGKMQCSKNISNQKKFMCWWHTIWCNCQWNCNLFFFFLINKYLYYLKYIEHNYTYHLWHPTNDK